MGSRSKIYLKDAVFSVLRGHLTPEAASEKYGIDGTALEEAIKNYCVTGKVDEQEGILKSLYRRFARFNARNLFSRLAPTYDSEKEMDRFRFKLAYTMASFLLVAAGMALVSSSELFAPGDMNARTFEDKFDQALLTTSRRQSTIDAEVKYLNKFYSRINKILDSSNSADSKALKNEVESRLAYINRIDKNDVAKKAVNFNEYSMGTDRKAAAEMYSRMHSAIAQNDRDGYFTKALEARIAAEKSGKANHVAIAAIGMPASAAPAPAFSAAAAADRAAVVASAEELKPEIEEPAAEEPAIEEETVVADANASAAGAEKHRVAAKAAAPAAVETVKASVAKAAAVKADDAAPAKSYKYAKTGFDTPKDRIFIINKYRRESLMKKAIARPNIKLKYPVATMIPVLDRKKYDDSFKKIATNPKPEKNVKIVEDRG